jgi:hypothetical protein
VCFARIPVLSCMGRPFAVDQSPHLRKTIEYLTNKSRESLTWLTKWTERVDFGIVNTAWKFCLHISERYELCENINFQYPTQNIFAAFSNEIQKFNPRNINRFSVSYFCTVCLLTGHSLRSSFFNILIHFLVSLILTICPAHRKLDLCIVTILTREYGFMSCHEASASRTI